jgi:catechol 2,3-dioxygenase-like lactoylglutathione lyase family enzyme
VVSTPVLHVGIVGIDHVQVSMPAGGEDEARAFYGDLLGLREVEKPAALRDRGGVWFQCGAQQLHCGIDPEALPGRSHPALLTDDLAEVREKLVAVGAEVVRDDLLPGFNRIYARDPFGNRLEILQPSG